MHFNDEISNRTVNLAAGIHLLVKKKSVSGFEKNHLDQLIRSSSSVAANYRAAVRARSDAEFLSKICIVLEECDETFFWLTFLQKIEVFTNEEIKDLASESEQLTRLFATTKKTMKEKVEKIVSCVSCVSPPRRT